MMGIKQQQRDQIRTFGWHITEHFHHHSTLTQICECVTANGLTYSKSAFVSLSRNEEDEIHSGDIKLILVHNEWCLLDQSAKKEMQLADLIANYKEINKKA